MDIVEAPPSARWQKAAPAKAYLWLALILPIFAIAPLFYPGFIQTHSGFVPPWNVADLRANPDQGGWFPHLALNFDPLRSDGLLPYYLAGLLPVGPMVAVKVIFGLGWLLGSVGVFLWLQSWLGQQGALVAALVYTYLPYQIVTVYVRGAWGEALFWGLLPWAIMAATFLATSPRPFLIPVAALFWVLPGLSHLGLTIWAFILAGLLGLVVYPRPSLLPALAALLGIGAAAVFYLALAAPLAVSSINFNDHFLLPFQLLSAFWGAGPSRPGWNDGLSLQLGLAAVGLSLLSLIVWQRDRLPGSSTGRTDRRLVFFWGAALVSILLQFSLSGPVWQLPLLPGYALARTLTYPWQLLGLTGLCLAVLAGSALWLDKGLAELPFLGSIIIFVLLSSYNYLSPQFIRADSFSPAGPQAQLGATQLALIRHDFSVLTSGNTAGLALGEIAIPLAVHGPPRAGQTLVLNVTWQPLQAFDQNWKIFVHLVDAGDRVLAQFDGPPRAGEYPTSHWIPGELIDDSYPIPMPVDAPPGPYRVFLGLYNEATLDRLPVSGDPAGRVILNVE